MKQTAVEWLTEKLRTEFGFAFSNNILEQAKEMEKKQQDEFAIEFAEWIRINEFRTTSKNNWIASDYEYYTTKELLKQLKNK